MSSGFASMFWGLHSLGRLNSPGPQHTGGNHGQSVLRSSLVSHADNAGMGCCALELVNCTAMETNMVGGPNK